MKKIIIVTGTPGTGKTTLSKELSLVLGYKYVDINKVIEAHDLSEGYDKERECDIVDTGKLVIQLEKMIKHTTSNMVIDGHMSHFLHSKYVDLCIITKCDLKILKTRLDKLYTEKKVRENLDVEIFDTCLEEAREQGHTLFVIDTSTLSVNQIMGKIKEKIGV